MKILRNLLAFAALLCLIQNSFATALIQLSLSGLPSTVNTYQTYDNVLLTITNPTATPLFLNQLSDTQYPKGFTQTATTCTNVLLAAKAQCTVTGNFIPTQAGTNTWSVKLAAENYVWTTPYTTSVAVQQAPRPPDQLDSQLQNDIDNFYAQFKNSPAFSAVQLSVLLPSESQSRDYIVGTQSVENPNIPATTTMLTQYGSITKEFTSALIIKYIDTHPSAINLQTSLGTLFPEEFSTGAWPSVWRIITIEQLMNMTSGIANGYPRSLAELNPNAQYTLESYVQEMAAEQNTKGCILQNGCFPAGAQFYYSNTNYELLGMIVGKLYGNPSESYDDAYALALNGNILDTQRAQGNAIYYALYYTPPILNQMINSYWGFDEQSTPYLHFGQNITSSNLSWIGSAGALTGNMHALVNIVHALFHNEILSPTETQILTQTGFIKTQTGEHVAFADRQTQCTQTCYGLGVMYISQFESPIYGDVYEYPGATQGFNTIYIWFPKYDAIIAFSLNTTQDSVRVPLATMEAAIIQHVIAYLNPGQAVPQLNTSLYTKFFNLEFNKNMLYVPNRSQEKL